MKFFLRLKTMIAMKLIIGSLLFVFRSEYMGVVFWFGAFVFFLYYLKLSRKARSGFNLDFNYQLGVLHIILSLLIYGLIPIMYVFGDGLFLIEVVLKTVAGTVFLLLGLKHVYK